METEVAFTITWQPPRPSGVRLCEFEHDGQRVEMKAAVCVQNTWKGKADSVDWLVDRDAWAQTNAQAIADRMDYAASAEGIKAVAQEEYNNLQGDINTATDRRAELKAEYPDLTELGV